MRLSIIIPCHNEAENLKPLYAALQEALGDIPDYEIIFVDDGSSDDTLLAIRGLRDQDDRVHYISFLRNYGHQQALIAGLKACTGDLAVTMDADLQHPPNHIPLLVEQQKRNAVHVVVAQRSDLQAGFLKNLFSKMFYWFFNLTTGVALTPGVSDFRLYTRRAVDVICQVQEKRPFLRGMIPSLGLKTELVVYTPNPRFAGTPAYTFRKSLHMAGQALMRYSNWPARFGMILGLLGVLLSFGLAVNYLYLRLFTDYLVPGQADLMVFLGLVCSTLLIMMSLQFRMLSQIQEYLRGDPEFLVDESSLPTDSQPCTQKRQRLE